MHKGWEAKLDLGNRQVFSVDKVKKIQEPAEELSRRKGLRHSPQGGVKSLYLNKVALYKHS